MMVIKWAHEGTSEAPKLRAAEYVRMSTEHQKYSTINQSDAIRAYAEARGYEIVQTYADDGKSGLNLSGRLALQKLLQDVESGSPGFEALLVYDVSRWGRFQDPDEAASYELSCRRAGVQVHYCAELFENDGSIGSSIIKTVKRAMAGEYSRELSVKVFAGQAALVKLGYRQGGAAGFGLRRMLIDQFGARKGLLERGEQKSIATDRVILVPGPSAEVATVRKIFAMFAEQGLQEREIADALNVQGIFSDLARPWTRGSVHQLLINEKYVGNNVWGRRSFKLRAELVQNAPEQWIRSDRAFAGIVDADLFEKAQTIIRARSDRLSDERMLELLSQVLKRQGTLSGLIIDEVEDCPSSSAFRSRFGGLLRAYALVGFAPDRDYRYLEINRKLRALHSDMIDTVLKEIACAGGSATQDPTTELLTINQEFTVSVVIVRCVQTSAGSSRWKLRLDSALRPDITLAIRMNSSNQRAYDYYLLPGLDMQEAVLRLAEHNGLSLDAYRYETLAPFYRMTARVPLRLAA